jgi:hypothetical protein
LDRAALGLVLRERQVELEEELDEFSPALHTEVALA